MHPFYNSQGTDKFKKNYASISEKLGSLLSQRSNANFINAYSKIEKKDLSTEVGALDSDYHNIPPLPDTRYKNKKVLNTMIYKPILQFPSETSPTLEEHDYESISSSGASITPPTNLQYNGLVENSMPEANSAIEINPAESNQIVPRGSKNGSLRITSFFESPASTTEANSNSCIFKKSKLVGYGIWVLLIGLILTSITTSLFLGLKKENTKICQILKVKSEKFAFEKRIEIKNFVNKDWIVYVNNDQDDDSNYYFGRNEKQMGYFGDGYYIIGKKHRKGLDNGFRLFEIASNSEKRVIRDKQISLSCLKYVDF